MFYFHLLCALGLSLSHGLFLLRGFYLLRQNLSPGTVDRWARNISRICLPLTFLSGLLRGFEPGRGLLLHILPALLIIILTPVHFLMRKFLLKTRRWPWLLPLVNFFLIIWAVVSGFLI